MAPSRKAVDNYNEYQANFVAFILWIKQVDSGECELPRDVSMASLPEYVRSNYAPMGKRFRNRCASIGTDLPHPNLDYAALDEDHEREQFMAAMQEKIAEPGFSQDAPRLGRLLREKWKD
ncbi:hypothetical protein IW146_008676 [Coemansia sp. RSA 922]|nr:hypothetical protein IW146_008676 [Coemansia sp. RSA 922]